MTHEEFYNSLSDELKEKVKACTSLEEMKAVLKEAGIELDSEVLEGLGGDSNEYCFCNECPLDQPCDLKLRANCPPHLRES